MGPGVEIRVVEYCGGPSFPDSTQGYRVGTGTGKEGSVLCRGLVRGILIRLRLPLDHRWIVVL